MRPAQAGAPESIDALWPLLRAAGLASDQLRRLSAAWGDEGPVEARLEMLVLAGVLTAYQAEQILAGKPGRLRLGPYRILDRIGSGGAGTVYKAEHILMKRLVALKVLGRAGRRRRRPEGASPGGGSKRRAELVTAGRLSHPHIVSAYDAARLRGRLVLVLEYVEGIDLERLVNEAGPLPVPLACEVVRQAALALGYLHERGLVHRDVKPANLLLMRGHPGGGGPRLPDGPPVVKLIDMGLACRAGEGGAEMCGTMDYVAPERGINPEVVDIRGDLYSLGCTFYHLLTGRVPFPGGSWTGKLIRHRLEEPEPIRELRPEVDAEVAAVVTRLMAREPADRYAEPGAVVGALDALVRRETTGEEGTRRQAGEETAATVQELASTTVEIHAPPGDFPSPPGGFPSPPGPLSQGGRGGERRARRFARMGPWALVATVLAGATLGGVARLSLPGPASIARTVWSAPVPAQALKRIFVSGIEQPFAELADAVDAAADGGIVTLHGPGPFPTGPIFVRGKALTLRAAGSVRPVIERQEAASAIWEALLASDAPLKLEGIDLNGGHARVSAPVVCVEGSSLHLRDCGIRAGSDGPLVALRRGEELVVEECRLAARMQALAVEMGEGQPCRVSLRGNHIEVRDLTGPALLLWSAEMGPPARVQVEINGSTMMAGRIVACRSLAGPIEVTARENRFAFHQGLVSFDGYRDREAWREVLCWNGEHNRYDAAGVWVRLEGQPRPAWTESAWEQLWAAR
jgi:hypothetical protein